jgi:large subunit ribosomal protein L3
MLGLLGKKIGMTQVFNEAGEPVSVTVVKAGPCPVVRQKTKAKEGYDAICIGFDPVIKEKRVSKPSAGVYKKAGLKPLRFTKEFKPAKSEGLEVGKDITVSIFKKGDYVDVQGVTKGRGFQGVIKRWGKSGGPAAHGSKFHRTTGSIGMRTWPGRVLAGTGMAGQMGNVNRTIKNLKIVDVDCEKNLLFLRGAVPGSKNSVVVVSSRAL